MSDTSVADPGATPTPAPSATDPAAAATIAAGGTTPPAPAAAPAPAPAAPAATPQPVPAVTPVPAADTTPKTIAAGDAPDTRLQVTADFPGDWREKMAGDDKKFLERLQRFNSPADVAKSYRELEGKVSSGKLKAVAEPLPENATAEQVTAWRAENGLPKDADAFVQGLVLPNGVVPGEADKPLIGSFAEAATAAGWSQKQYNEALSWYYGVQDQLIGERQEQDSNYHIEATRELQQEWGTDFKQNLTRITQFFDAFFPKDGDDIRSARLADGRLLGNDPVFNRVILEVSKVINPAQTVLPNIQGATVTNVNERIKEIETKYLRAPRNTPEGEAYWNGGVAKEYHELLQARETMLARQGAGR